MNNNHFEEELFNTLIDKIKSYASNKKQTVANIEWIDTPLGAMVAIAHTKALLLLAFLNQKGLESTVDQLQLAPSSTMVSGKNPIIDLLKTELKCYFSGQLKQFTTSLDLQGTDFQKQAWNALLTVPYGETRSYREQAILIDRPTAYRAVANANASNRLCIILPCHRIINTNGALGGYGGSLERKEWLLKHEKQFN